MRLVTSLQKLPMSIITKNTSKMEQTTAQWLIEQLENHNGVTRAAFENVIQQAIEKEKEQIVQAFNHGRNVGSVGSPNVDGNYYYKQIFKSE